MNPTIIAILFSLVGCARTSSNELTVKVPEIEVAKAVVQAAAPEKRRKLKGVVILKNDLFDKPQSDIAVTVSKDGKELVRGFTDTKGYFDLAAEMTPGRYTLQVDDKRFSGSIVVPVNSLETTDIKLTVTRTP